MKFLERREHASTMLLVAFLARPVFASAWGRPQSVLSLRPSPITFQNPNSASGATRKVHSGCLKSSETSDDIAQPEVNKKRLIEVTSEVELPFSREVAFDAYSDLTRQPSWSSWLHSVEYTDETKEISKWTMKFMGVKYSWMAVALRNERPDLIQWQSTSGLQNFGTVQFLPRNDSEKPTLMTMKMTFVAPRAAAGIFRRSKAMADFVKNKMVLDSMANFRDVVLKTDLKAS